MYPEEQDLNPEKMMGLILAEHAAFNETLENLGIDWEQPGVLDDWSVKDLLAHITAWEERLLEWTAASLRGETPERPAPGMTWDDLDRLNAQTYQANKDRPLADVRADYQACFERVCAALEKLDPADLFDPARFPWRAGEPLWHMVAANTWWHYREHREALQAWLKSHSAPPPGGEAGDASP